MHSNSHSPPLYAFKQVLCVLLLCARSEAIVWQVPTLPSAETIRGYESLSIVGMLMLLCLILLWTVRHLWTRDITLSDQQRERLVQRISEIEALLEKALDVGESNKELLRSAQEQSAGLRQREHEHLELKAILNELKSAITRLSEQIGSWMPRGKQ